MKTTEDIKDLLYSYLAKSELKKAVTGDIYVDQRPQGSIKEDVVIGAIDIGSGSVQHGAFNVNIHVPAVTVKIGKVEQSQPDRKRLRLLSRIAIDLLKEVILGGVCSVWVANQTVIKEPNLDNWFANIRLEIRTHEV